MGEVQWRTFGQLSLPPPKTTLPVSPSTALSLSAFMNQTRACVLPSVVVVIGDPPPAVVTHQATRGTGGAAAGIDTEAMPAARPKPGQMTPPMFSARCTPSVEV